MFLFSFSKEDEVERERRERRERRENNQTEEEVVSLPVKGKGGSWIFFRSGPNIKLDLTIKTILQLIIPTLPDSYFLVNFNYLGP